MPFLRFNKAREKYHSIIGSMSDGFAYFKTVLDKSGKPIDYIIWELNDAFETQTGFKKEAVLGRKLSEFIPEIENENDSFDWVGTYNKVINTGKSIVFEYYINSFGKYFSVSAYSCQSGFIATIFRDITVQKKAELEYKAIYERFKCIYEQSPIAIGIFDESGSLFHANKACIELFGVADIEQAKVVNLFGDPNLTPEIKEDIKKGKIIRLEYILDFEIIKQFNVYKTNKSGRVILDYLLTPLYTSSTTHIGFMLQIQDITEKRRAEQEVVLLNKQLEQRVAERTRQLELANKELESFSYSVSHDLRAPLRSIDGFGKALLEDYHDKLDEQGKHFIDRIRKGTSNMGKLIDNLLNLSRLSRSEIHLTEVNLSKLVSGIADHFKSINPSRNMDFVIEDGIIVKGDKVLLQSAMENLIGNAVKFTSKHQSSRIEFGMLVEEDCRVYFVKDDGAGFNSAYSNKLFGAFQRLHDNSDFDGTGIGLANVQRIVLRHGGRIWAEGEVEKGATFYFTLNEGGTLNEFECS